MVSESLYRWLTAECKSLRESGDAIRKFDVAYFAASCDGAEKNKKFSESLELDYPILSDAKKDTATAYGVVSKLRPFPHRHTFYIGKDGKILAIDKKVSAGSAGADIATKHAKLGVEEAK